MRTHDELLELLEEDELELELDDDEDELELLELLDDELELLDDEASNQIYKRPLCIEVSDVQATTPQSLPVKQTAFLDFSL
jgi:hypothetical protein